MLPPVTETPGASNSYLRDRVKTFQPRELWEWLLKMAVILFVADVGIRRIYLDRAEWLKATENLRRWLLFWRGKPRPVEADESLAALLSRRGQVRIAKTGAGEQRPELFEPVKPVVVAAGEAGTQQKESAAPKPPEPPKPEPGPDRAAVTSRLLDAKRRASKRLDQS